MGSYRGPWPFCQWRRITMMTGATQKCKNPRKPLPNVVHRVEIEDPLQAWNDLQLDRDKDKIKTICVCVQRETFSPPRWYRLSNRVGSI